jgi:uncharacterized linocin/CFP29 family protein
VTGPFGREVAPVADAAWAAIEEEARRTLATLLAGRRVVGFRGPLGWEACAVGLGRLGEPLEEPVPGARLRLRRSAPLAELRVPFVLTRTELDDAARGAKDLDLGPLTEAARTLAWAEDRLVFLGHSRAGIRGVCSASPHRPLEAPDEVERWPAALAQAVGHLRRHGVGGPYAVVAGTDAYTRLIATLDRAGRPVAAAVERLSEARLVVTDALEGLLVVSVRGGDAELVVGQDATVCYEGCDDAVVHLALVETLTVLVHDPGAAVVVEVRPA